MLEEWSDERYYYRIISPPQIIQHSKGPLNLSNLEPIANRSPLDRRIANQRILENYMTEQGLNGWELVTQILYEGLPYGGGLIFRKKIKVEKKDVEVSNEDVNFEEKENVNLYTLFEEETGKNAIWKGKETKAFIEWKEKKVKNESKDDLRQ